MVFKTFAVRRPTLFLTCAVFCLDYDVWMSGFQTFQWQDTYVISAVSCLAWTTSDYKISAGRIVFYFRRELFSLEYDVWVSDFRNFRWQETSACSLLRCLFLRLRHLSEWFSKPPFAGDIRYLFMSWALQLGLRRLSEWFSTLPFPASSVVSCVLFPGLRRLSEWFLNASIPSFFCRELRSVPWTTTFEWVIFKTDRILRTRLLGQHNAVSVSGCGQVLHELYVLFCVIMIVMDYVWPLEIMIVMDYLWRLIL